MMRAILTLALFVACTDTGAEHCCASRDIRACLAEFTAPNHCKVAECPTADTFVCRLADGGLSNEWPDDGGVP